MGAESHIRQRVVALLKKAKLDPISVENPVHPGTPDVNHLNGWLELKQLPRWPKRSGTPVRVAHFTAQQRVWLRRRALAGGKVHVLLRVGDEWLLFEGGWASLNLGFLSAAELRAGAVHYWATGLNEQELITCLRSLT